MVLKNPVKFVFPPGNLIFKFIFTSGNKNMSTVLTTLLVGFPIITTPVETCALSLLEQELTCPLKQPFGC